tara:strand:- start:2744 stop:3877 length:1134 start_codon:yes stop_codon:yes gene_type:complete
MAYIGNAPAEAYTNTVKDSFNGTGSATAFTLSQPTLTNDVRVVVENVVQDPAVAYNVSGTALTFTSAPPSGTDNIYVVHLGPAVMTTVPPAEIADATTFASSVSVQGAFTSLGIDDNATSTAITIDASENVLVGKTVSDFNTQGFEINSGGQLRNSRASGAVAFLNRKTDNGIIVDFGKDGTVVGSIGSKASSGVSKLTIGTGDAGLWFTDNLDSIIPVNVTTNAATDGTLDIGYSANRFKDLYLSGGIYLGGTAAANKLDDIEEGTFSATLGRSGFTTTFSSISGERYVKIGRMVFVDMTLSFTTTGYNADYSRIDGLPFAVNGDGCIASYSSGRIADNANGGKGIFGGGSSSLYLYDANNTITDTGWRVSGWYYT